MEFVHVFILTTLALDRSGDVKARMSLLRSISSKPKITETRE
jgi:hypothetical protein